MDTENGAATPTEAPVEGTSERPRPARPRPRTARALPTDRLKFELQVRALRALALESQNGARAVGAPELANRIGVADSTAPLNNAFFAEAGLAIKAGRGLFKPTQATLDFERDAGFEDIETAARKHLAGPLSRAWFFGEIKSQISMGDAAESRIMSVLTNAAGASSVHRVKLISLLDWLALAGLITREGGEIKLSATGASATPQQHGQKQDGETPKTPPGETPPAPEVPPAGEGTTKIQEDRGPVVLEVKFSCSYTAKDLAELEPEHIKALYEAVGGVQAVQAVLLKGREDT